MRGAWVLVAALISFSIGVCTGGPVSSVPGASFSSSNIETVGIDVAEVAVEEDTMTKTRSVAKLIPPDLTNESKMQMLQAASLDGRQDMQARKCDPLDSDCDSFQLGESEAYPIGRTVVHMNNMVATTTMADGSANHMKEQTLSSREVLPDNRMFVLPTTDDPSITGPAPVLGSLDPIEMDANLRAQDLPQPTTESRKSKCSKWINGHDVPDPLAMLDDDCGMPEPIIPCETAGNSSACVPRLQVAPPPLPEAELMPPIPPPPYEPLNRSTEVTVSVEFVDLGRSVQTTLSREARVGEAIERAGQGYGIKGWMVQLARSGGADVPITTRLAFVPDEAAVIVYLRCIARVQYGELIMPLIACEDMAVRHFAARVEVPSHSEVYDVAVLSTDRVGAVLLKTPLRLKDIERVTYDGEVVTLQSPLEELHFRNRSALVVYPVQPCPSHSPTVSLSPSPSAPLPSLSPSGSPSPTPFPHKRKVRKLGAYDAYRHCTNARGEPVQLPDPASLGLDPTAVDPSGRATDPSVQCEGSEMTVEEEPDYSQSGAVRVDIPAIEPSNVIPREPMTKRAVVTVLFEGRRIPVLVKPNAKGIDIFDAVERATGRPHKAMVAKFLDNSNINHYSPLRPLGLVTGDVVEVIDMARVKAAQRQ